MWVVVVLAQGDNTDNGEDNGKAEGNNNWVEDEDGDEEEDKEEDEDEYESGNTCVVIVPPLHYRGRCCYTALPLNSTN